jgi:hypothetical protein
MPVCRFYTRFAAIFVLKAGSAGPQADENSDNCRVDSGIFGRADGRAALCIPKKGISDQLSSKNQGCSLNLNYQRIRQLQGECIRIPAAPNYLP